MKKIICILLITILMYGCIKEWRTSYSSDVINTTQHHISILCYNHWSGGTDNDTFNIPPNTSINTSKGSQRGSKNVTNRVYFPSSLLYADSVVVVFDNQYKMVHYSTDTISNPALKSYLLNSNRNILNKSNHDFSFSKSERSQYFKYTFTEQDYIEASR